MLLRSLLFRVLLGLTQWSLIDLQK
jgi:hypothetical protein